MNFKTPLSKLVRHFQQSREKWKMRAIENQQYLRKLQVKVRDLEASRKQWKGRAKRAKKELSRTCLDNGSPETYLEMLPKAPPETQPKTLSECPSERPTTPNPLEPYFEAPQKEGSIKNSLVATHGEAPKWHSYPVYVIYLSICQVVRAFTGFRGGARSLETVAEVMGTDSPCYGSIRLWTYRMGLYLLQLPVEHRDDRIFIMDMTVELGHNKCLLILGISESQFRQGDFCLEQHDTKILGLEIFNRSTGEDIAVCLEKLAAKIGTPKQIVSDQGSDIKKGIQLYQARHPEVFCLTNPTPVLRGSFPDNRRVLVSK
jgi:hypothetical protein